MTSALDLRKIRLRQWLAALAASSAILGIGRFDVKSIEDAGMQAGLISIGAIIGAIIADIFGRRVTLLVSSICVIPVILFQLSTDKVTSCFYLVGEGIMQVVVPLYVSEIGDANNIGNLMVLSLPIRYFWSVFTSTIYATHNNPTEVERFATSVIVVAGMIFRITIWCLYPETPHYLNWTKRYQATANSLAFFRENKPLGSIREPVISNNWQGCREKMTEMGKLEFWKSLGIILSLITIQWGSGALNKTKHLDHPIVHISDGKLFGLVVFALLSLIVSVFVMLTVRVLGNKYTLVWVIGTDFCVHLSGLLRGVTNYWWGFVTILCIRQVVDLIFTGVTLAYAGEFFTVNVRSIAIVMIIIWDRLMSIIYFSIRWALWGDLIFGNASLVIWLWCFYASVALFISFYFIIIVFPRVNKVPCSEIKIPNSTDMELAQLEQNQ